MNQCIKDTVYNRGTKRQVAFMAQLGGMNEEEEKMLFLIHDGKTDEFIQQELSISRTARERIEEAVRAKLLLAIFDCINRAMDD